MVCCAKNLRLVMISIVNAAFLSVIISERERSKRKGKRKGERKRKKEKREGQINSRELENILELENNHFQPGL